MNAAATGIWLTPQRMRVVAAMMLAGTVIALGYLFVTAKGTVDSFGRPVGTDFSSFWTAGRMALDGHAAAAYDWKMHWAVQKQTHGIDLFYPWSYPPVFLLVTATLAVLPYLPAFLLWQSASLLAALAVFRAILPRRAALLYALGFPAVLICFGHGQTGFLTGALLGGGVLALQRNEVVAGVLFGLLIYKPQFGILLPFVLAAGGYWRAFVAAAATVVVTIGASIAIWGWPVWQAFFRSVSLTEKIVFEAGDTGFEKFQSIFAFVRSLGGPLSLAYGAQAVVTLGALAACVWIWRSEAAHRLKGAALLTGALLSSPYMLDYDLIAFGLAIALVVAHGLKRGFHPWEKTVLAVAWFSPAIDRAIAGATFIPLGFLMLAAVFLLIVRRVRAEQGAAVPAVPAAARG
ncbi:MAG TPA: glycosyltransferase family 87 protein [Pseudolabrys sp.]|nr:glycosyltransferase family 87 protein [Pseudolabrys sp.]